MGAAFIAISDAALVIKRCGAGCHFLSTQRTVCQDPCNYIPPRSYLLFLAREVLDGLAEDGSALIYRVDSNLLVTSSIGL
jgi:hypothetical protein